MTLLAIIVIGAFVWAMIGIHEEDKKAAREREIRKLKHKLEETDVSR
jgi:hypothetical protein